MGFGDLLKKGLQEVGKAIKESYNEGTLGDSGYRAMIETLEKKGNYAKAAELKEKLRQRIREREEEAKRKREEARRKREEEDRY